MWRRATPGAEAGRPAEAATRVGGGAVGAETTPMGTDTIGNRGYCVHSRTGHGTRRLGTRHEPSVSGDGCDRGS